MSENLDTPEEINQKYTGQKREEICNANQFYQFKNDKCAYIPCEYLSIHSCDNPILNDRCTIILDSNNVPKCLPNNFKYSNVQYLLFIFIYCIIIGYIDIRHNRILNKIITDIKSKS